MTLYTLGHIKDFSLFLDTWVGRCKTLDYGEFLKLKIHINVLKKKKECIFDLEVKGQGPTKVITVRDTPPYGHAPTYQI
jgi:hypothetical protein